MLSATDHFNTDFDTTCKKIPRYSGELTRQMADRFIAQNYFHGVLVHSQGCHQVDSFVLTCYPRTADEKVNVSMSRGYQVIVLHRSPALYFRSNSIVFISIVGFNNEDNCCQSEGIGKSIKETLSKGTLRVD